MSETIVFLAIWAMFGVTVAVIGHIIHCVRMAEKFTGKGKFYER